MPIDKQTIIDANAKFASTYTEDEDWDSRPRKRTAYITCMDAWIHEAAAFGIELGDAHIIRNAGASAKEALRSLIISQQILETDQIILVKHTKCGMEGNTNEKIRQRVKNQIGVSVEHIDFLPFEELVRAVEDDVEWLRTHELIPGIVKQNILGFIFDVRTGLLTPVI